MNQNTRQSAGEFPGIVDSFGHALARHGVDLVRARTTTLQVNVAYVCNQTCRHCHLEAGPNRHEIMSAETVEQVAVFAEKWACQAIDLTGGAPELHPHLPAMIARFSTLAPRIMVRSNLTALEQTACHFLLDIFAKHGVVVVASVPSLNQAQLQAQRGAGVWERTLTTLRKLNNLGYGKPETGLELNLVSNPSGAYLPPSQDQTEKQFRRKLQQDWDIVFNKLYTFANVPLGRFRNWLLASGNYERYMRKLAASFNPCVVENLMCRTLVSVSWDGYLYDCDFNQAAGLPAGGTKAHVSESDGPPPPDTPIACADHCYACTAGSGFT
ncbi:MAG: arsenosugar biosynthesis radical SAM protein ArsS [Desulfomonile tiedjei]|nr:arsenosugar biosynthesis radical SAM protein ArsS [Desulfomonile tiedjei]